MSVRGFDGVDDVLECAIGAAPGGNSALTILCLWKPLALEDGCLIRALDSVAGTNAYAINPFSDGNVYFSNGNFTSMPYSAADGWLITGFSKAAGSAAATGHRYSFNTGVWTHPALGVLNGTTNVADLVRFGWFTGSEFGQMRLAAIAVYAANLTNVAVETLDQALADWLTLAPAALWPFTQTSVADPVIDATGGGADQTSIVGTMVVTSDDPPGFNLNLGITVTGSVDLSLGSLDLNASGVRTTHGTATINLGALALTASSITGGPIPMADDFYSPGPCRPYEYVTLCPIPAETAAVSGYALDAASEILYYATAQRFDTCQVTIRPCRKECSGDAWPVLSSGWWEFGGGGPMPALINGLWYNIACGSCGDTCSCTRISETVLPGPVREIVQVTVDGQVLTNNVDYRLDDYRKLVRLGGAIWPLCNDLTKGITEVGTWSVTAIYGLPLPALGKLAMGELFCDILSDIAGGACNLPGNITDLTRQGVTMTFETIEEALKEGFEGLKYVDKFIKRYNPNNLQARPYMYDLDAPDFRVTNTVIT